MEREINYQSIEQDMQELFKYYGNGIDFGFDNDDEAYVSVSKLSLMEDEDTILEDVKNIFKCHNINAEYEWDYDSGDEYTQICELQITLL